MRWLALLATLALGGCFTDQKQQAAACATEAMRTYPNDDFVVGSRSSTYAETCMSAHGYDFYISDKRCLLQKRMEANPYCYTPSDWLARAVYEFEANLFDRAVKPGRGT